LATPGAEQSSGGGAGSTAPLLVHVESPVVASAIRHLLEEK